MSDVPSESKKMEKVLIGRTLSCLLGQQSAPMQEDQYNSPFTNVNMAYVRLTKA